MKKIRVAILGSTSHIAKGLIYNFFQDEKFGLSLYTRSSEKVRDFLNSLKEKKGNDCIIRKGYGNFLKSAHDIVINCVGAGTLNKFQGDYTKYFTIAEGYDNLVIKYLRNNPEALYISFSSGAVYGGKFLKPAGENTTNCIAVNHIFPESYYSIARLNAETKHRAFKNLKIIDLRLFSYFSRFIDLTDNYFIVEILNCVLSKKIFKTDDINIVRDYIHPQDLFSAIKKCIAAKDINGAFDISSVKPIAKKEILDYFASEYGLKHQIVASNWANPTGSKLKYYSIYNNAKHLGYKPIFSSLDAIREESKHIIKNT